MKEKNNSFKWRKIDSNVEESFFNNIRFVRPIDDEPISLYCPNCKELVSSIQDVEQIKKNNKCLVCVNIY